MPALSLLLTLLAAAGAAPAEGPVAAPVQQAVEAKLARLAVEMVPGSLERAAGPDSSPYRFFTFKDARAQQTRGVAVSDSGEVAVAGDPESFGRFFAASKFFDRHGPADALEVWRILNQAAPILDLAAIQALPEDEKKAVFPARREEKAAGAGAQVSGFVRQGEEIFRVQLDVSPTRAEVKLKALSELLGRDEVDEAIRALRSPDEIVRAAAAFELAEKKAPKAFEALVGALEDRSGNVRTTVVDALQRQVKLDESHRAAAYSACQKALVKEEDPATKEVLAAAVAAWKPAEPDKKPAERKGAKKGK
ncbi:MAG: HEAT repeat domain-containing protein [Myxococcales bacterium]